MLDCNRMRDIDTNAWSMRREFERVGEQVQAEMLVSEMPRKSTSKQ